MTDCRRRQPWILLLCLLATGTFAQAAGQGRPLLKSKAFTTADGLAHQIVRDVVKAPDGAFWIATWGGGISRFDGENWETFNEGVLLSDFMIRCLAVDSQGVLWAGTPEGIRRFDGRQWELFSRINTPGLLQDSVFAILPRPNGVVWFGMMEGYLYAYDPGKPGEQRWELIRPPEAFKHGTIRSFHQGSSGEIWIGADHIYRYDGRDWTQHPLGQVVFAFAETSEGDLYVAATDSVFRYHRGAWLPVPDGGKNTRSMGFAPDGSLLVGTESGIRVFRDGFWSDFVPEEGEAAPYVEVIRSFPDGATWIGTRGGAHLLRRSEWTVFPARDRRGPLSHRLFHTSPQSEPLLILPTGEVQQLSGLAWNPVGDLGEASNPVVEIVFVDEDRLVIRRERSLVEYDRRTLSPRWAIPMAGAEAWSTVNLSGARGWDFVGRTSEGTIWWNREADGVLCRWNGTAWTVPERTFKPGSRVDFFQETRDGRRWMVADRSVAVDDRHLVDLDLLGHPRHRGHRITSIALGEQGEVWLGLSGSGIITYDGIEVRRWDAANGLPGEWVRQLYLAADGAMWVGMVNSMVASYRDGRWVSFDQRDFQLEGIVAGIAESPDGSLWFATESGELLRYRATRNSPETVIDLHPGSVVPGGNALFTFRGWDEQRLYLPAELVYSWRIVDADHDTEVVGWSAPGPALTVSAPALPPGDYVFEVRAEDRARNVDPTPASVAFTVQPHLYLQPAFWLVATPALLLIGFLSLRWFQARRSLVRLARVDGLTQVFRRDYASQLFEAEIQRAQRYQRPLSVLLLDIDHFKKINDSFGHDIGDQVLREASRRIRNSCRASDLVARWGGEEFILILPETNVDEAAKLAERVRTAVAGAPVTTKQGEIPCSASFGLVQLSAWLANANRMLTAADRALYRAKNGGRNRIEVAGDADFC